MLPVPDGIEVHINTSVFKRNPSTVCKGFAGTLVSAFVHAGLFHNPSLTDAEAAVSGCADEHTHELDLVAVLAAELIENIAHEALGKLVKESSLILEFVAPVNQARGLLICF